MLVINFNAFMFWTVSENIVTLLFYQRWQAKFFIRPQIENPQIPGIIPLAQIRKFLSSASPQIGNSQIGNQ